MRIGIDAKNLTGPLSGISRYVSSMITHLAQENAQITLFAPRAITGWSFDFPNVEIVHGSYRSRMEKLFWSSFVLPRLARERPELDVFWGPAHRLSSFLPAELPKIVTIHDLVWQQFPETMPRLSLLGERSLMPGSIEQADAIVAPSFATIDDIEEAFPGARPKLECIYPGPTRVSASAVETNTTPYALFVGTLEPRKNLARLIDAYAKLPQKDRAACKLKIVGAKGWRIDDLVDVSKRGEFANDVEFLGFVSDAELEALYAGCQFLVMPSLGEGFGLPIIEAQKYGKPVLTSKTTSMPEVAREGGIYVDPHSSESITRALSQLINDNELRQRLSQNALINIQRFSWEKAAVQFIKLAQKLQSQSEQHAKSIAFL